MCVCAKVLVGRLCCAPQKLYSSVYLLYIFTLWKWSMIGATLKKNYGLLKEWLRQEVPIEIFLDQLISLLKRGLCAGIYTVMTLKNDKDTNGFTIFSFFFSLYWDTCLENLWGIIPQCAIEKRSTHNSLHELRSIIFYINNFISFFLSIKNPWFGYN